MNTRYIKKFIWATGKPASDILEAAGLQLLYYDQPNDTYIYVNDENAKFERTKKTMRFTNDLYF